MRLFAALAVLILASCTSTRRDPVPPPPLAPQPLDLAGAPFILSAITVKGKAIELPATRRPTMQFDDSKTKVSGLAGVNRYSGAAALSGKDGIAFGPMMSTKMAGPPEAMALESGFLDALSTVTRVEYRAGTLKLASADASTSLTLTREK